MVNLTEVIGDPDRYGQSIAIAAVLPLIDMVAGRCAYARAAGPVVTGSFDDVELLAPLYHGELISADAQVLAVGKSSMLLRVSLSRNILLQGEPRFPLVLRCHTTFVAVDDRTRTPRPIPPPPDQTDQNAQLQTPMAAVQAKYKQNRRLFSTDDLSALHAIAESRTCYTTLYNYTPDSQLQHINSTSICVRKQYLPRHLNFAGIVFGGDILQTLERTAVVCANRIQGGQILQTIAIRNLAFLQPVPATKVLQVEAKVITTSERVVCVMVRSYLDEDPEMIPCHHAIFHLIPVEREGCQRKLSVGVRSIWKRDDDHIRDFYRAMAFPLTSRVKAAWGLEDDVFPSEREDDWGHEQRSPVSRS